MAEQRSAFNKTFGGPDGSYGMNDIKDFLQGRYSNSGTNSGTMSHDEAVLRQQPRLGGSSKKLPNGRWDKNKVVVNPNGIPNGPGPGGTWPGSTPMANTSGLGWTDDDTGWKNVKPGQITAKPQAPLDDYTAQTAPVTTIKKKAPAGKKTVRTVAKKTVAPRAKAKPRTQMVQMARTTSGNPFAKNFGGWGQLFQGDKTTKSGKPITLSKYNEKRSAAGMDPMRQEAINRLKKEQGIGRRKKVNTSDPIDLF